MQRTYTYEPSKYKFKIVIMGYAVIFFGLFCLIQWLRAPGLNLYIFGVIAAIYGTFNTFIQKCNPSAITVDDESITFHAFGEKKYLISDFEMFNIRENANAQFFIRIKDRAGKAQRYWVNYYYFSEREDLINELYHIQMQIEPDNIKFRGRQKQFMYRPGQEPEGWFLVADEEDED